MTEQEKIQELLKPRYKVIADYPFNKHFKIGEILTLFSTINDKKEVEYYFHHPETHQNFQDHWFNTYTTNFKRLEWYEERKPEEMPEYVKPTEDAVMEGYSYPVKITGYHKVYPEWFYCEEYPGATMTLENFIPATLAEYTQYINSKPQP